jgi:predicted AAA+ superfamily ATPase
MSEIAMSALQILTLNSRFESWTVSEIIKHRMNRGESNGVNFFRDQSGLEADMIVRRGKLLTAVEMKSGQTIAADWAKNATRVTHDLGNSTTAPVVVHGGKERQTRSGVEFLPWNALHQYSWVK